MTLKKKAELGFILPIMPSLIGMQPLLKIAISPARSKILTYPDKIGIVKIICTGIFIPGVSIIMLYSSRENVDENLHFIIVLPKLKYKKTAISGQ